MIKISKEIDSDSVEIELRGGRTTYEETPLVEAICCGNLRSFSEWIKREKMERKWKIFVVILKYVRI